LLLSSNQPVDLIVIGGGPAGFMGAITAAQNGAISVLLLEATPKTLEKVRLSGGGRCNVTHACWDPIDLSFNYPRGRLPLLGPFSRFSTGDAVAWFAEKGLKLVIEPDGRMFPLSNSSLEVVSCLRKSAKEVGVHCLLKSTVQRLEHIKKNFFLVHVQGQKTIQAKRVLLATGGHPSGRKLASSLGHKIIHPVPSLFSLKLDAFPFISCSGVSLNDIKLKLNVAGKCFKEYGRILITHRGLTGPAILRLSAFAARELHQNRYKAKLCINWINCDQEMASDLVRQFCYRSARKRLGSSRPFKQLPKRFWLTILKALQINSDMRWSELSSTLEKRLLNYLLRSSYDVCGRGPYGEEFVTAGGVTSSEVDFSTMQSSLIPGLYFAGELLDVDGVTGGFNFQHCWTSGWIAGKSIIQDLHDI
tara:strand:- start:552 stop:1805 length:1254 start_codon:yes stop_codon:yes gene_type:complete